MPRLPIRRKSFGLSLLRPRRLGYALAVLTCLIATQRSADAVLIVVPSSPVISGTAGSTGFIEFNVQNTGPTEINFEAFSLALSVDPAAGVQFTSASTDTVGLPYVFQGVSFVQLTGSDFAAGVTFPVSSLTASDFVFDQPGYRTILAGEVFGLARIGYRIGNSDVSNVSIGLTFVPVFTPAAVVPEPGTFVQSAFCLSMLTGVFLYRRFR